MAPNYFRNLFNLGRRLAGMSLIVALGGLTACNHTGTTGGSGTGTTGGSATGALDPPKRIIIKQLKVSPSKDDGFSVKDDVSFAAIKFNYVTCLSGDDVPLGMADFKDIDDDDIGEWEWVTQDITGYSANDNKPYLNPDEIIAFVLYEYDNCTNASNCARAETFTYNGCQRTVNFSSRQGKYLRQLILYDDVTINIQKEYIGANIDNGIRLQILNK